MIAVGHDTIRFFEVATASPRATIQGPGDDIKIFAISPDGMTIASGSTKGIIWLSDIATGTHRATLQGHVWPILQIKFSPDSTTILSCSVDADHALRVWDTKLGAQRKALRGYEINNGCLGAFETGGDIRSKDGKMAFATLKNDTVIVWDAVNGNSLHTIQLPADKTPINLACSLDGGLVALSFTDYTVSLWDSVTGRIQREFKSEDSIHYIVFSPDNRALATSSANSVRLWDTATYASPHTLRGHDKPVRTAEISPDNKTAVSSAYDNTVRLWDAAAGACLHTHRVPNEEVRTGDYPLYGRNMTAAFSPDNRILAAALFDCTIRLWDTATGVLLHELDCCRNIFDRLIFSPDNRTLAAFEENPKFQDRKTSLTIGNISTVHLWEISTGVHRTLTAFEDNNLPEYIHNMIPRLFSAVHLLEASIGDYFPPLQVYKSDVTAFAFSIDSKMAVSASTVQHNKSMSPSFKVRLWDATTGTDHKTLMGHTSRITAVGFSMCGQNVASGSEDCTVRLWDLKTGIHHKTLTGHTGRIESVAFSPSGLILDSSSLDLTVRLWDMATGGHQQTIKVGESIPRSLSFSDDGRCLKTNCGILMSSTAAWSFPSVRPRFRPALIIDKEWVAKQPPAPKL
ncbi:WD40 repeat-like protein [Penicillium brevicompactum]|uniref:WD40 repeat-like protein n=1 Tax=Penicillium brevicompactum TaxID=5074 RepID=A0A9W9QK38_PENBR|nr:WD40 repeat-like protein [Penicillium brevicompactum]